MRLNGTASVICFKDQASAERCSAALRQKGTAAASARPLMLEEVMDRVADAALEICLVDEVIETVLDDAAGGDGDDAQLLPGVIATDQRDAPLGQAGVSERPAPGESSLAPAAVRQMLQGLYDRAPSSRGERDRAQPPPDAD